MDLRFHPRTKAQKELRFQPRPPGCGWPGYVSSQPEADGFWGLPRRHRAAANSALCYGGGYRPTLGVSVGTLTSLQASPSMGMRWDTRGLQTLVNTWGRRLGVLPDPEPVTPKPPPEPWETWEGHILD